MSDEDCWASMQKRFEDLAELVEMARPETEEEALGTVVEQWQDKHGTKSKWRSSRPECFDDKLGLPVPAWNLVPYIAQLDQEDVRLRLASARDRIPRLEKHFAERSLTPEFARDWGAFCAEAGAVELLFFARWADLSGDRRRIQKSLAPQRKWVAIQLLNLIGRGQRRVDAEAKILNEVRRILKGGDGWDGFPNSWFEEIVTDDRAALRTTFTSNGTLAKHKLDAEAQTPFAVPKTIF